MLYEWKAPAVIRKFTEEEYIKKEMEAYNSQPSSLRLENARKELKKSILFDLKQDEKNLLAKLEETTKPKIKTDLDEMGHDQFIRIYIILNEKYEYRNEYSKVFSQLNRSYNLRPTEAVRDSRLKMDLSIIETAARKVHGRLSQLNINFVPWVKGLYGIGIVLIFLVVIIQSASIIGTSEVVKWSSSKTGVCKILCFRKIRKSLVKLQANFSLKI